MFASAALYLAFTSILVTESLAIRTRRATCPDGTTTATNTQCCQWYTIRDDIQSSMFQNQCGEEVHEALRLAFHDAMGYSPTNGGGGADGSILTFQDTELAYADNAGLQDAVDLITPYLSTYSNVTSGDFLQFAAAVGISNCAGAPTMSFFAGRPAPSAASPDGTVPVQTDDVDTILTRFSEVGISSDEVVALLASHSIGAANFDTGITEAPLDSTPGTFDSQFYVEVLLNGTLWPGNADTAGEVESPLAGELRIESDYLIARDSRTACTWQNYIDDQSGMASAFAAAMLKLSLVAQDQSSMTDCSEVIPAAAANNAAPYYPSTLTQSDIQQACTETAFPSLTQSTAVVSASAVLA